MPAVSTGAGSVPVVRSHAGQKLAFSAPPWLRQGHRPDSAPEGLAFHRPLPGRLGLVVALRCAANQRATGYGYVEADGAICAVTLRTIATTRQAVTFPRLSAMALVLPPRFTMYSHLHGAHHLTRRSVDIGGMRFGMCGAERRMLPSGPLRNDLRTGDLSGCQGPRGGADPGTVWTELLPRSELVCPRD